MARILKPLREVTHEAIQLLTREIGVTDTLRFLNQFSSGHGNYREERERLFEGQSFEEAVKAIRDKRSA